MLRPAAHLSKKLIRPIRTKDGGTLRTVLDARAYMLGLSKGRELRSQWQRACELLLPVDPMRSGDAYHPGSGSSSPLMISTPTVSPLIICFSRVVLAIVLALLPLPLPVQAQNYPTRPIRLISPFPAGGANDVLARVLAGKLAERLRGSVVVENRPGAGAVIGLTVLARSAPDGYTLALSGSTLAVAGTLYKQPPFDAMKDFAPVALVTNYPFVLVVNPSLPAHSVPELIRLAKEQPGKLLYASPGPASSQHLYTELFKGMAGIELGHIPYSGTAPAVVDILAGRVALMFAAAAPTLPLIREGKLRALGVTSIERLEEAPEIPPIADSIPGFNALNWTILLAPAGTPKEIMVMLRGELKAIMAMRDVQAQIGRIGMFPVDSPEPGSLASFISAEVTRWGRIVQQAGIARTQ
jgi:tripartite-type tricarboxylate transporter receptor subunit TctC